ncbi:vesicle formation at the endoplasmic reticulum [Hypocenomyce scalaris]|nr:vesicle formation at the endoplasmic reticulum [Hypocenomyce scalaris]
MLWLKCLIGLLSVLTILAGVQATPSTELEFLEKLRGIPQGWHQGPGPPASERIRFRIAVKQQNAFDFEEHVLQISTPGHPRYGQHMKWDELKAMLRPSSDATNSIIGWLDSEGVPSADIEDDGDWINLYVPITEAERILNTSFYCYSSSINNVKKIRILQYSVPRKLHQYIQMIQPTTRFGQMQAERSTVFDHFRVDRREQQELQSI